MELQSLINTEKIKNSFFYNGIDSTSTYLPITSYPNLKELNISIQNNNLFSTVQSINQSVKNLQNQSASSDSGT